MENPKLHQSGVVSRVPATDIETIIVKSLNEHLIAQEKPVFSLTKSAKPPPMAERKPEVLQLRE
jgi:hypothetical protein